ncbi:MAG: RimK family alpha-L-glutamate ligase [Anaerolineales bacterium]|nr:RimK family alpha-L-glutamate ligase [Anaerolineales bacterium]
MRIGILSRNRKLYSTRRLVQAAHARGHSVAVIDTMTVTLEMGMPPSDDDLMHTLRHGIITRTVPLPEVDAIIPRIGTSITPYGLAVVRQFEGRGVLTTATAEAIACSRDKLHSSQLMSQANLPIPRTAVTSHPEGLFAAIHAVGGLPVIIKSSRGTQGRGIVLAHNLKTAAAAVAQLRQAGRQALVQEFVAEAAGKDLRLIVVGDRCVAAMQRTAVQGEFRANLHLGGTAVTVPIDAETNRLAVAAAQVHGLDVTGVDIIQSQRGPLLLEVNSSPGLEGIERTTSVDIAAQIILFLEKRRALPSARKQKKRAGKQ